MTTVNPRITEIQDLLVTMQNDNVFSKLGTDRERQVLADCVNVTLGSARKLRELIISGLTYQSWLELYHTEYLDKSLALEVNVGNQQMIDLVEELKALDLSDYYEQMIESTQTIELSTQRIEEMAYNYSQLQEIWAEEDAESAAVEVNDPSVPAFDPDLVVHLDSTLVEKA